MPKDWPLPGPPETVEDVQTVAAWAMTRLDPAIARAVSGLCSVWLKAHSVGVLGKRLKELEQAMSRATRRT